MTRTSVTLFTKLFESVEHFEQQFPTIPRSFLNNLMSRFDVNPESDWIHWIIDTNNNLFKHGGNEGNSQWLGPFHELLAQLLLRYDALANTHHPLMSSSSFMRDCYLNRHYGFHSFPLIKKHIDSITNLPFAKVFYYQNDPVFEDSLVNPVAKLQGSASSSPLLDNHSTYRNNHYFKLIVTYYGNPNASAIKFAGISIPKGGVSNIVQIILEQGAHVRFFGGISPSLSMESAYNHGPIFMCTSHLQQMQNEEIYHAPISSLIFILPDIQMREDLRQWLHKVSNYGLITADEVNNTLENQMFTYHEYWERYCQVSLSVEETAMSHMGSSQTMSELIEGSPLRCRQTLFQPYRAEMKAIELESLESSLLSDDAIQFG